MAITVLQCKNSHVAGECQWHASRMREGLNSQEVENTLHLCYCVELCPDPYHNIG